MFALSGNQKYRMPSWYQKPESDPMKKEVHLVITGPIIVPPSGFQKVLNKFGHRYPRVRGLCWAPGSAQRYQLPQDSEALAWSLFPG